MAVAFVKNHPVASNKTAGTTLAVTLDTIVPAGNLMVLRIVCDNGAAAFTPSMSVITIARAAGETNIWVSAGGAAHNAATTAGAFAAGSMWYFRTAVDWPAASYTITLDTSVTQKAAFIQEFSGVLFAPRCTQGGAYSTTTTAASATTTGTTPVIGDLAIGFIFGANAAANQAGDNDTTGGSWSAVAGVGTTGGSGTTNNWGIGQYKILTGASHQTLNNSAAMTAGNGAFVAILQQYVPPSITQAAYRFYADGTETGATALAAQDTAPTVDTSAGDVNLQVRARLQSTTAVAVGATDDWQLQWEKNTSGTWTNVAASTVVPYASANLTDGAATTNRLGAGSGSFVAGKVSEDGLVDDLGWTANNHTEVLYSVTLKQADLTPTDTLRFRVLRNGATTGLTYTQYPSITIGTAGPTDRTGTATGSITLGGTASGTKEVTGTATGTLSVAGTASGSAAAAPILGQAVGTLTVAGVAAGVHGVAGTATGSLAVAGVASGQKTVGATATGALSVAGTAIGVRGRPGAATGTLSVAGTAAGTRATTGTATGQLSVAGVASGAVSGAVTGTAVGSLAVTGVASGVKTVTATATGQLTVTGVASGVHGVTGTATGALAVAGTATGQKVVRATATATIAVSGTSSGQKTVRATATGQIVVVGIAVGLPEGNAAGRGIGQLTVAGTATGVRGRPGQATGTITVVGLATGRRATTATATGLITIAGIAVAVRATVGTATGTLTVTGVALGHIPVAFDIQGEWNGQPVDALQWGDTTVVDWYMLTPT